MTTEAGELLQRGRTVLFVFGNRRTFADLHQKFAAMDCERPPPLDLTIPLQVASNQTHGLDWEAQRVVWCVWINSRAKVRIGGNDSLSEAKGHRQTPYGASAGIAHLPRLRKSRVFCPWWQVGPPCRG